MLRGNYTTTYIRDELYAFFDPFNRDSIIGGLKTTKLSNVSLKGLGRVNESPEYIFAVLYIGGMFIKYLSGYLLKRKK